MWKNHIKIAARKLAKSKLNTAIHVLGLSIGIACCFVIFLFVQYHLQFDTQYPYADRIYRVGLINQEPEVLNYGGNTPYVMGAAMRNEFPDMEKVGSLHIDGEATIQKSDGEKYKAEVLFADGDFFDIFDFKVLEGDASTALNLPNQAVITKSLADKIYSGQKAIGQTISLGGKLNLTIAAIMEDLPKTSHLQGELITSFTSFTTDYFGIDVDSWGTTLSGCTYVRLGPNESPDRYEAGLKGFAKKYLTSEEEETNIELYLQPLADIHFDQRYTAGGTRPSINPLYLWFFSGLGALILLVACINFINLSTAQSVQRAQEIGIRKVVGAQRRQLIGQFLGETFLVTVLSVFLSVLMVELMLPYFNASFDLPLQVDYIANPSLLVFFLLLTLFITILAGLYPAVVIARFRPVLAIKTGMAQMGRGNSWMRKGLVTVQFCISTLLVIGSLAIGQQLHFVQQKSLGFDQDAILVMDISNREKLASFREQLLADPNISAVSFSLGAPTSSNNISSSLYRSPEDKADWVKVALKTVDGNYFETFGLQMAAGRPLNPDDQRKMDQAGDDAKDFPFVINEKLAQKLGFAQATDALNQTYTIGVNDIRGRIVGVVRDFNMHSLHQEIIPLIMFPYKDLYFRAGIKVKTSDLESTLTHIEQKWEKFNPGQVFEYDFLDENIRQLYESETRLLSLFGVLSGMAILIACLGLWGLITYITQQKTKEIGVRKVLGASVMQIINLLSREFSGLVILGFLLAAPMAYFGLSRWLDNFAYHIQLSIGLFLFAGLMVYLLALLTVSYQSYRAAMANPAEALRAE
ncbi:MAG: ABC transporter permease [Saprospiraceae bacterium]|nr:MAG: ABC transporter permease [Saprospiraceae bacterium]